MTTILKEIILDFQEAVPTTGVPRRVKVISVPGKATVCIGVRRGGKSTFMFQIIQQLQDKGVSRRNILYLNFFDDRLHNLRHDSLGVILDAYFSLYPEKKNTENIYCFFDEIQIVSGWEPFIDRLIRTEKCEVYITGSSAQMLSKEIATQMRGRALSWEMFPFSFREFLDFQKIECDGPLSTNPEERDKCLSQIIFLQKNKKIICKALKKADYSEGLRRILGNGGFPGGCWTRPSFTNKNPSGILERHVAARSCGAS